jgi:transposase
MYPAESQPFGGTCHLHLEGWRISQARNHCESASCWFLAWLILQSWRWRQYVPPKHSLTLNVLHGVISQKTETFIIVSFFLLIHYEIRSIQTSLCSSKLKSWCHYNRIYQYKRRQKAASCSLLSSNSKMGRSGEPSDFKGVLIIGCHISKTSVRAIATLLKLPKSAVGDVIVKRKREGTTTTKPRPGRLRLMTDRDRQALKKVVHETHNTLSETITHEFRSATNCPASTVTVHREFKRNGVPWVSSCP